MHRYLETVKGGVATQRVEMTIVRHVVDTVAAAASPDKTIGILGLSFKPGTDDVRDSPSRHVIAGLSDRGYANIVAYDPIAVEKFRRNYPDLDIQYVESLDAIRKKVDVMVLLTAWPEFRELQAKADRIIDFRYFV